MKTTDLRNLTWDRLQPMLRGARLAVLQTFRQHGPGTTQALAPRSGLSLLTFRPRACELHQLGLLELIDREGTEGIYRAVPAEQARAAFEAARDAACGAEQTLLKL